MAKVEEFCARCEKVTECTPDSRSVLHLWCSECGVNVYEPEKRAPRPGIVQQLDGWDHAPLWSESRMEPMQTVVRVETTVVDEGGRTIRRLSKREQRRARRAARIRTVSE